MSTYAIGHIVNQVCKKLSNDQIYLNIGCWKGFTLVSGMVDTNCKVIGVDNFSQFKGPKNEFYKNFENYQNKEKHFFTMRTIKFFLKNSKRKMRESAFIIMMGSTHTKINMKILI